MFSSIKQSLKKSKTMETEPTRGRPSKEKKQRNGPLSLALYQHFVDYLCGEFLPSPDDLLRAGFKSEANHPFKMQEKFMFWATKMTYDEESGYLVHKQTQRFIIPREKFDEAIRQAHVTDFGELLEETATPKIELNSDGRKIRPKKKTDHNGLNVTLKNLQSVYTFGRRSFGMTTEIVKSALRKCRQEKCCLFNQIGGPRKKGNCSGLPKEEQEEETDEYDGRQEVGLGGDTLIGSQEVDPYDLVFGSPTDLPDFGCSDTNSNGAVGEDDVVADDPQKSSKDNSSSSKCAHPLDYFKKSLSSSNIASHRDDTGINRAVKHPEIAQYHNIPQKSSSAAGALPDDEDRGEMSADSDRSEVTKSIDGIQCTRTVLDGVTFYEYDVPGEDMGQETMSLPKRKRRRGSDEEESDYAPKQWKRRRQVEHMPTTRRSSSSDGEKKSDAMVPHSKSMGDLDYLAGVSDISSESMEIDEGVMENVGLYRVRGVKGKPRFGSNGESQVDRFGTILDIHQGARKKKVGSSPSTTSDSSAKIEDVEMRLRNQQSRTSTANQRHDNKASICQEDAEMDVGTIKLKVTVSSFHSQKRCMLPSFMESLGLRACPRPPSSNSSGELVIAETEDDSDDNEEGLTASRATETDHPSSQVQTTDSDQTAKDSLDRSFDDRVSEGVDVTGYTNFGSSQAEDSSNASSSQESYPDCSDGRLDSKEDNVITSEPRPSISAFLDGKEAILPDGRKVRVYCRNTEYSEPKGPKPSVKAIDVDVVPESERVGKNEVKDKQLCTLLLTGGNHNIDPSSQENWSKVPIGVIHPLQQNLTRRGDEILMPAALESASADLPIYPGVTDPVQQDDTEEDTANISLIKGGAIETPLSPVMKILDPNVAIPGTPNNSEKSDFEDHLDKSPSTEGPSVYAVEMIQNKEKMKFVPLEGMVDPLKTPGSKTSWGHFQLKDGRLLMREATPPSRITRRKTSFTPTKQSSPVELSCNPKSSPTLLSVGGTISVSQSPTVKSPAMKTQCSERDFNTEKTFKIFSAPDGKYYCFEPKTQSYRSILPKTVLLKTTPPKPTLPKTKWDPNNPNQKIDIGVGRAVHKKVSSIKDGRSLPLKKKIITSADSSNGIQVTTVEMPVSQATSVPITVENVLVEQGREKSAFMKREGNIKEDNIPLNKEPGHASKDIGIKFVTTNSTNPLKVLVQRKPTVRQLLDLQDKDRKDNTCDHLLEESVPMKDTMNLTIKELINLSEQMKEPYKSQGDRNSEIAADVDQGQPGKDEPKIVDLDEAADSGFILDEMLERSTASMDINNNSCGDERKDNHAKKDAGLRLDQFVGSISQELRSMPQVTLVDVTEECKKNIKKKRHISTPTEYSLKRKREQIATLQQLQKLHVKGQYDYKKELESVREEMTEEKFNRLCELVECRLEREQEKVRVTQLMQQRIALMKQENLDGVGSGVREELEQGASSRDAGQPSTKLSNSREKLKAAINVVNRSHGTIIKQKDAKLQLSTTEPSATTLREQQETLQRGGVQVAAAPSQHATNAGLNAEADGWRAESGGRRAEADGRRAKTDAQRAEAGGRRAEADGRRVETDGRKAETDGRKAETDGRRAEVDRQRVEADGWRAEADRQMVEADGRRAEADGWGVETDGRRVETDGQRAEADGRRVEADGRRAEVDGRRAETDVRRAEADGRMAEAGGQRVEADGHRAEADGRRVEADGQRAEADGWRVETDGRRVETDGRRVETDGRRVETDGRRVETDGRRVESDGRRVEADGQRVEADGRRVESDGRRTEADGRRAEADEPKAEADGQKAKADYQRQVAKDQAQRLSDERQLKADKIADQRRIAKDKVQRLAHERQVAADRINDQRQMVAAQGLRAADQRQMAADQRQMAVDRIAHQRRMADDRIVDQRRWIRDTEESTFKTSVTGKVIPTGMKFYYVQPKSTAATSTTATHAISSPFDRSEYFPVEKRRMGHTTVQAPVIDSLGKQNVNQSSASHGDAGQTSCRELGEQTRAAATAVRTTATLGSRNGREQVESKTEMETKHSVDYDVLPDDAKLDKEKPVKRRRKWIKRTESGVLELIRTGDGTKRKNPIPISSMPLPTAAHFANIKCPPANSQPNCEASQTTVPQSKASAKLTILSPPTSKAYCPPCTSYATCGAYTHSSTTYAYSHAPAYMMEPYVSNYVTPQKQHQRCQWFSEATPPRRIPTPESTHRYQMMPARPEGVQRSSHCLFPTNPASFAAAAYLPGVVGVPAAKAEVKQGSKEVDEYEMLTNTIRDMRHFIRPAQAGRRYSMNVLGNLLIPRATNQVQRFRRLLEDERMRDRKQ